MKKKPSVTAAYTLAQDMGFIYYVITGHDSEGPGWVWANKPGLNGSWSDIQTAFGYIPKAYRGAFSQAEQQLVNVSGGNLHIVS